MSRRIHFRLEEVFYYSERLLDDVLYSRLYLEDYFSLSGTWSISMSLSSVASTPFSGIL